jgi:hypothetical protein
MGDEDAGDAAQESVWAEQVEQRAARVDGAIRAGKFADALRFAVSDAPFASKDAATKDRSFEVFARAVQALGGRDDVLSAAMDGLAEADTADAAMKYILRGLKSADQSATLLKMHGLLVERAGMGCLVRAMVDRKTA